MKSQTTRFYISAEHLFFYVKTCRFHLLLKENLSLSGEPDVPFRKIKKAFYLLIRQFGLILSSSLIVDFCVREKHFLCNIYWVLIISFLLTHGEKTSTKIHRYCPSNKKNPTFLRSSSCVMTDFSHQFYISNRFIMFNNLILTIPSMEPIFSRTNLSISLNVAL